MRFKSLNILWKKRLDPSRRKAVFTEYDKQRGYQRYHQYCQSVVTRKFSPKDDMLSTQGLEHITVFDEPTSATTLGSLLAKSEGSIQKENIDYSEMLQVNDDIFLRQMFQNIFTPSIDHKLLHYFKSEYFVYWFAIFHTIPSPQSRRSFLWHCDKGPSRHLKILLYLNDTAVHGGNTEFFDREFTRKFSESGYLFGPVDARQSDLSDLAKKLDLPYQPKKWSMHAGDAIIFEPSQILHRGILPNHGSRYVLTLCLLPSPIPWHTAFDLTKGVGISQNYNWHTNARDIQQYFNS
ncbi:MAG: hypothetical protein NPIRA04_17600 [Nitrospirales bacterium]|nr:MAG: hypothetical protein NPIRA04_17600 [Nitrospirales bacterium]